MQYDPMKNGALRVVTLSNSLGGARGVLSFLLERLDIGGLRKHVVTTSCAHRLPPLRIRDGAYRWLVLPSPPLARGVAALLAEVGGEREHCAAGGEHAGVAHAEGECAPCRFSASR